MKTTQTRIISLLLALALLVLAVPACAEKEASIFDARWKQLKEIKANGRERNLSGGNIYAVLEFGPEAFTSSSYSGEKCMLTMRGECTIEGNRITLTMAMSVRSGSYAIEGDTLTITWDDGAQFIFERMPE